jgi:hypothetical protein
VDLNRLTLGARIIALSGLLLFIDSFIPWFRSCADLRVIGGGKFCVSDSGWGNALTILAVLVSLALVGLIAAELAGVALPPLGGISWGQAQLIGSGVVAFFVLLQFLIGDHHLGRSVGSWLGLVIAAAMVYGGYLRSREAQQPPIPRQHLG